MDLEYFKKCFDLGLVKSPFMEIGSAKVQNSPLPNLTEFARNHGVNQTLGVDLEPGKGVDATVDFSQEQRKFNENWKQGDFSTVAIFNVLEHTFDPITVLRNALRCVAKGGVLLVVTPVVWTIHNYPRDYNRLLPDWYEEFARLNEIKIREEAFCWLSSQFGICRVDELKEKSLHVLPTFMSRGKKHSPLRYWTTRAVHKLFNTYGRSHYYPDVAIGVAFDC